eukprot:CAMPEP_0194269494 /NCGR_PEP_ID=MMETSP0169-20130528/3626_1 /TAXON_ID=218684 /ORGANISM="Corethron pennatum, Strain L29A3" /LENGTH=686 /DNA_ID=CAMNT_0039011157 /DNA_START=98 /DNA_END=2157 /DNA_ORIENTATION=-
MKLNIATSILTVALAINPSGAFSPLVPGSRITRRNGFSKLSMAMDMPTEEAASSIAADPPAIVRRSPGEVLAVRYSEFTSMVDSNQIEKVTFSSDGTKLLGVDTDGGRLKIDALPNDPDLLNQLTAHKVDVTVLPAEQPSAVGDLAQSLILPAVLFGGLFLLSRRGQDQGGGGMPGAGGPMGGMGGQMGQMGKSAAKVQMVPDTGVTFNEVAGCDGAKLELMEVVDFLKKPEKYSDLGAKIPRGVILDGPPGTGKTLLAKAVAGEAGVPFFSCSGSEFVEMFVGVGASRVRDLFEQAKKNAPCIIFIDEIDAVGRQRGGGQQGGNDEREQTLNQILTEMDGFDGNPGIITVAATNRADVLDAALLRPGRFDRRVTVDLPDFKGRTAVLKVHARGKPIEPDVDLEAVARRTPGFSGASLQNLLNEAAIFAARKKKSTVGWEEIDSAVDRIMVGLEKKGGTSEQSLQRKELVAFHEAGHAIVGAAMPDYDQIQKITIIPRSNGAGGVNFFFAPSDIRLESGLYSRQYLESQLAVALGGRLAEELIFGEDGVTTGASNDIEQVANIAKRMVTEWGMSSKLGPIALQEANAGPKNPYQPGTDWGGEICTLADAEIERLVNNSYLTAKKILTDNRLLLNDLSKVLCEREQVTLEEFQMMQVEYGLKMIDFDVIGEERNREGLPFQTLPTQV